MGVEGIYHSWLLEVSRTSPEVVREHQDPDSQGQPPCRSLEIVLQLLTTKIIILHYATDHHPASGEEDPHPSQDGEVGSCHPHPPKY